MNNVSPSMPGIPALPQPQTSGLAVTSLVLGILGLTCLLPVVGGIAALIFGLVALSKINKSGGALGGQGLAIAGIVTGGLGIVLIPLVAAVMLPALTQARESARRVQCAAQLKQIGLGIAMYYNDQNPNKMPAKLDDILPFIDNNQKLFTCPSAPNKSARSYQLIPGVVWATQLRQVLVTEPDSNHRGQGHCELYNDGSVEWVRARR